MFSNNFDIEQLLRQIKRNSMFSVNMIVYFPGNQGNVNNPGSTGTGLAGLAALPGISDILGRSTFT